MNLVDIHRLKPHPKNQEYFGDVQGEKYKEIKRSIEANGIRDPLKVLPDYTVIAGHQRLRIAAELGLAQVPVVVCDIPVVDAEYLLIADNEERRGSDEDPMRKASRAKFLKEYWGIKGRGPSKGFRENHENSKTSKEVAEAVGTDASNLSHLLKLNDLIPPLQSLVSSGKFGATAAEQLAHLPVEEQQALWNVFGEAIGQEKVEEVKDIRRQLDAEREKQKKADHELRDLRDKIIGQQETIDQLNNGDVIPREAQRQIDLLEEELEAMRNREQEIQGAERTPERVAQELQQLRQEKRDAESRITIQEQAIKSYEERIELYKEREKEHTLLKSKYADLKWERQRGKKNLTDEMQKKASLLPTMFSTRVVSFVQDTVDLIALAPNLQELNPQAWPTIEKALDALDRHATQLRLAIRAAQEGRENSVVVEGEMRYVE